MTTPSLPTGLRLREATAHDTDAIRSLLAGSGLGGDDIEPVEGRFIVADRGEHGIAGCVALDGRGVELLLRSLAVHPSMRGLGLGRLLVDAALLDAWARRARRVVLVTEGAEAFFAAQGFEPIDRSDVEARTAEHRQFNGACPDSASTMALDLDVFG